MIALILGTLVALLLLVTAFTAWRYPHLRRMALRNFAMHKNMTVLTILGAMVGTALIASTLLLQSSMMQSKERVFQEQFGRIYSDLPAKAGFWTQEDYEKAAALSHDKQYPLIDGTLATVGLETTLLKKDASGQPLLLNPKTYVHGFDPKQAAQFDEEAMQGVPVDLKADEIVLSTPAAEQLEVAAGDKVTVLDSKQAEQTFRVRAVVPEQGLTGYRGLDKSLSTALVSLDTARQLAGVPAGRYTDFLLSKKETFLPGVKGLFGVRNTSGYGVLTLGSGYQERAIRASTEFDLNNATKFIPIFNIASINAVVIGVVLILNIFKMTAEERRQELGVLRAVGLTRRALSRTLRMEGLLYALCAGVVGVAAGIGVSCLLLLGMKSTMASMMESDSGLTIGYAFSIDPQVLVTAFSIGVLLVSLSMWFVSRKAAKLPIVEALQAADSGRSQAFLTRGQSMRRTAGALVTAVVTLGFLLMTLTDSFQQAVQENDVFPLLIFGIGFAMIFLVVFLFVTSMSVLTGFVQWMLSPCKKLRGVLRLSLRYPEVRRSRTGLLLAMFALVFFLTSFSGVFSQSMTKFFGRFDDRAALAGYDLTATAHGRMLTTEALQQVLQNFGYVQTDALQDTASVWQATVTQEVVRGGVKGMVEDTVNGIDGDFASHTALKLTARDSNYRSDQAAWEAVAQDPNVAIISEHFHESYKVGDNFPLKTTAKKIIGIAQYHNESYGYLSSYGVWVKQNEIPQLEPNARAVQSQLLLQLTSEEKASGHLKSVAKGIEKALTLQSIYPLVNPSEALQVSTSYINVFFSLFEGFSALATLIGIVGLMVVMFRVIRERRQQIGMLRAIGVEPGMIYWSLLIEGALIGVSGIALGLLVGTYTGYMMIAAFSIDSAGGRADVLTVNLPYLRLALYFAGALLATLLCSAIPARKAMRVEPAEATRYIG